jgi:hypothetical protein
MAGYHGGACVVNTVHYQQVPANVKGQLRGGSGLASTTQRH